MSEKIYAWLLRLYPSRFHEEYGEEALQLFRDRARNEKGFFPELRLWLDLLADLAVSIPSEYQRIQTLLMGASTRQRSDGTPSFHVLEGEAPRLGALLFGGVLSLLALGATSVLMNHGGGYQPPSASATQPQLSDDLRSSGNRHPASQTAGDEEGKTLPSGPPAAAPEASTGNDARPDDLRSKSQPGASQPPQTKAPGTEDRKSQQARLERVDDEPNPHNDTNGFNRPSTTAGAPQPAQSRTKEVNGPAGAGSIPVKTMNPLLASQLGMHRPSAAAVDEEMKLDAAQRRRVIDGAIVNLQEYCVDPALAQKMADELRTHEKNGDDDAQTDGAAFADLLTRQMRDVSHDRHLEIVYRRIRIPERTPGPPPELVVNYRKEMERSNCTFEKIMVLPHNIGYLKLNSFPDPAVCQQTAAAAMASLNHVDAIIFDLRDNHGGSPAMVALMASYLFDRPTHLNDMYNRRENSTHQSWTRPAIPGNTLAAKPAYVLVSASTFSGAEEFSYDLKMLKRATIVGEKTRGGANMASKHRIDDHFEIFVPDTKPVNPVSGTNWSGTGVEPEIRVKAADALKTAQQLAASKLVKK